MSKILQNDDDEDITSRETRRQKTAKSLFVSLSIWNQNVQREFIAILSSKLL